MDIGEEQRVLAEAAVPGIVDEVARLRSIISDARYCMSVDAPCAAAACLEGNGLDDGIAKSDLDRLHEERDALRARVERLRRVYMGRDWDPQATEDWYVGRGILEPGDLVDPESARG